MIRAFWEQYWTGWRPPFVKFWSGLLLQDVGLSQLSLWQQLQAEHIGLDHVGQILRGAFGLVAGGLLIEASGYFTPGRRPWPERIRRLLRRRGVES